MITAEEVGGGGCPGVGAGLEKQEEPGRKLPGSSLLRQAGGEIQSLDIQDGNLALGGIDGFEPERCQIFNQTESIFPALWGCRDESDYHVCWRREIWN